MRRLAILNSESMTRTHPHLQVWPIRRRLPARTKGIGQAPRTGGAQGCVLNSGAWRLAPHPITAAVSVPGPALPGRRPPFRAESPPRPLPRARELASRSAPCSARGA